MPRVPITPALTHPDIRLARLDPRACESDFIAVLVCEDEEPPTLELLDSATEGDVGRSLQSREFRPKPFEVYATRFKGLAPRLFCVGGGPRAGLTVERVRKLASAAGWALRQRGARRIAWRCPCAGPLAVPFARAAAEGFVLASLGADRFKTRANELTTLEAVTILGDDTVGLDEAVTRGALDGRCTNVARWLSDEPANTLSPDALVQETARLFQGSPVSVEVLDESDVERLGMGLIAAVARGSVEPPRVLVLRYRPAGGTGSGVLALVGKGVTFDSGGISIKPADGMDRMKHDMSGAAAVIGAMYGIGQLAPATEVLGIVPCVENMPGGAAFRPGDIITSASGKTVEILNTDAEGRLILGDAIWLARQRGATHLVDVATLTGACVVALGKVCSGLFGQPDAWVDAVSAVADRVGERLWRLPCDDGYSDLLKSDYADLANVGGRAAGAVAGAMFLREFAENTPWVHLDVAGTAWAEQPQPGQPKGATGVTVRTLMELATSGLVTES